MSKLTTTERKWLSEVQAVLDRCPSDRIGFYTTGDCTVFTWNLDKTDAVNDHCCDFYEAVKKERASFSITLKFPAQVESTAG
ncbi:hypothetical protein LU631_09715 [Erwinia tracheiphila]|uniref:Uncharacterized protein n=1 Tax=Erwinia tracheiphila TaxID=65700 RepID=A0A0M2KF93_9GAMM|nr:hypothetical protein [Erwinia tracheiphila]EOS94068.1 hypothetical protein ETR_15736 [Erwinia tracheiphila PSU-1]KKF38050.1 hypothetical protein SY86_00485 [Erwinia tracheiphila]UIA89439.1 hypothetical protein LU631_09715 [Erwinia tracheiphila]UIA97821.1 hypothetical protein LU633_08395 [Erwinia tracheiphila]